MIATKKIETIVVVAVCGCSGTITTHYWTECSRQQSRNFLVIEIVREQHDRRELEAVSVAVISNG